MAQVVFYGDENKVRGSKLHTLSMKINNGERLTDNEKAFLHEKVNSGVTTPRGCTMLMGVIIDFRNVMKRYFVETDYHIVAQWAFDKTTIRKNYGSKIYNIVEVPYKNK